MGSNRSRNWACIIYKESAPEDFISRIGDNLLTGFLSPLHNDKLDEQTEKKNHWHLLLKFTSDKSYEQAKAIFETIGGVGAECVHDFRAYARYLCHLDQPNKTKYDVSEVKCFGGLDYLDTIAAPSDRYTIIAEMQDFCEDNPDLIRDSFALLCRYARTNHKDEWFRALCDYAAFGMTSFLQSLHWTRKHTKDVEIIDE